MQVSFWPLSSPKNAMYPIKQVVVSEDGGANDKNRHNEIKKRIFCSRNKKSHCRDKQGDEAYAQVDAANHSPSFARRTHCYLTLCCAAGHVELPLKCCGARGRSAPAKC